MHDNLEFKSKASLHLLDNDGVLFDPHSQRIFRLNRTSTLLWSYFECGWPRSTVEARLSEHHGLSSNSAAQYVSAALSEWRQAGLLDGPISGARHAVVNGESRPSTLRQTSLTKSARKVRRSVPACFRILDSTIAVQGLSESLRASMKEAFADMAVPGQRETDLICDLFADHEGYRLAYEDQVLDRCEALESVVPMIKASLIQLAIGKAVASAVLHAAALWRDGTGLVLPGPAGAGKSTLAAALVDNGWSLVADDVTVLGPEGLLTMRPLPSALCLKSGSWPVMAELVPEFERLAVHCRADGKSVRFLLPRNPLAKDIDRLPVNLIAFPRYREGASVTFRRLTADESFDRILPEFYPVSNRFDGETIDALIGLLRQAPVFELHYGDSGAAVAALRQWIG